VRLHRPRHLHLRPGRAHAGHLIERLLAELPPRVRAVVDTGAFARLRSTEHPIVERLAEATQSHVVAYDLRTTGGDGLALCATVTEAEIDRDQVAALRAGERELAPWIALVAYARPAELRQPEEALLRTAAAGRST
jgi:CheY-like chemotaxis protein